MNDFKEYTFHFYRLVSTSAVDPLSMLFEDHIQNGTNIPIFHIQGDHYIQVQELNKIYDGQISGFVKKFFTKDLPHIGKFEKSDERPIHLKKHETLVEKTFFLYNVPHQVLLYQTTPQRTSCEQFSRYMAKMQQDDIQLRPLMTRSTYDMLIKGDPIRKFTVHFARPTNPEMLEIQGGLTDDWSSRKLSFLDVTGGATMTVSVSAGPPAKEDKEEKNLTSEANKFMLSLINKFSDNEKPASDLHGKIETADEHSLDLFGERLSAKANISIENVYPAKDTIITKMIDLMREKEAEFLAIIKRKRG